MDSDLGDLFGGIVPFLGVGADLFKEGNKELR